MYPKCNWWIHWEKNDPEPTIYPRCSHWFPGHLAPSVGSRPGTVSSQVCETMRAAREVWKLIARGNETSESDCDDGAEIANENDEG